MISKRHCLLNGFQEKKANSKEGERYVNTLSIVQALILGKTPSGKSKKQKVLREVSSEFWPDDLNAPDPYYTPEPEDAPNRGVPATRQSIQDTVDMIQAIFQEIQHQERQIAAHQQLADDLQRDAQRLKTMASVQVDQTRRLEDMVRHYRGMKTKEAGWEHEEVFGEFDAHMKVWKGSRDCGEIDEYDRVEEGIFARDRNEGADD